MVICANPIQSFGELRDYVQQVLCLHHDLEVGSYPVSQRRLVKNGDTCGISFCVHGPRLMRLMAIWVAAANEVHFFDSAGDRFGVKRLSHPLSAPWDERASLSVTPNKQHG
jgi:hypothetical protein